MPEYGTCWALMWTHPFSSSRAKIWVCTRSWPCTQVQKWALGPFVHTIFVSSGQSTTLFLLLSSCFKMASNRAKWSHYVHSHIWGTQSVSTTLFCAGNQALVPGHRVDNPFTFLLSSEPRPCYNLGTGMICVDQKWGEMGWYCGEYYKRDSLQILDLSLEIWVSDEMLGRHRNCVVWKGVLW